MITTGGSMDIKVVLCNEGITKGFAECRRLIFMDALFVNDKKVKEFEFDVKEGDIVRVGKNTVFVVHG